MLLYSMYILSERILMSVFTQYVNIMSIYIDMYKYIPINMYYIMWTYINMCIHIKGGVLVV